MKLTSTCSRMHGHGHHTARLTFELQNKPSLYIAYAHCEIHSTVVESFGSIGCTVIYAEVLFEDISVKVRPPIFFFFFLNLIRPRSPAADCNHGLVVTTSSCLSRSVSLRRSCGVTEVIEQLINPTPTAHTLLQSSGPAHTHTHAHSHTQTYNAPLIAVKST